MDEPAVGSWWLFEVAVSIAFMLDTSLTFHTAYTDHNKLILNKAMIRDNYLRTWFTVDVLSSIPIELIDVIILEYEQGAEANYLHTLRILRLMRLLRLLRLLRVFKLQRYVSLVEESLDINMQMLQLVKVMGIILCSAHLLGCAWFWLASHASDGERTWLTEFDPDAVNTDKWNQYVIAVRTPTPCVA